MRGKFNLSNLYLLLRIIIVLHGFLSIWIYINETPFYWSVFLGLTSLFSIIVDFKNSSLFKFVVLTISIVVLVLLYGIGLLPPIAIMLMAISILYYLFFYYNLRNELIKDRITILGRYSNEYLELLVSTLVYLYPLFFLLGILYKTEFQIPSPQIFEDVLCYWLFFILENIGLVMISYNILHFIKRAFNRTISFPIIISLFFLSYVLLALNFGVLFFIMKDSLSIWNYNKIPETLLNSIYFSFVNITSTGFGDIIPKNNVGKLYSVLESLFGYFYSVYVIGLAFSSKSIENHKLK